LRSFLGGEFSAAASAAAIIESVKIPPVTLMPSLVGKFSAASITIDCVNIGRALLRPSLFVVNKLSSSASFAALFIESVKPGIMTSFLGRFSAAAATIDCVNIERPF